MGRITRMKTTPKQGYKLVKSLFGKYEEIPEDWDFTKISQACKKITSGGTPDRSKLEYYNGGDILWIKSGELNESYLNDSEEKISSSGLENSSAKIFPKNTVLVAMYGATIGKTAILNKEASTNQAICAILPDDSFDPFYLQQLLISKKNVLISFGMGAGQPNISQEIIKNFKVEWVTPLKEQQKIASILSNVDSLIRKTQNEIELTLRLKKGLMQRLLTKGIGHTKFKKVKLLFGKDEKIPEKWEIKSVSEIAIVTMGQSPSGESYTTDKGIPLLNGPTEFGPEYPTPMQFTTSPTKLCQENDVLLCVRGSTTGRLNLANGEYCIGRGLAAIRGLKNTTHTKWLYYQYVKYQNDIYNIASGGGSTFPNINQDLIKKMLLPFPKFEEQQKIALILSSLDFQIQKEQEYKSTLETLKKGLMQKLLTGQIRVKI